MTDNSTSWIKLDGDDLGQHYFNLGIYGAIVGALCVISMVRTIYFFVICMKSSVKLHDKMFESVLGAPCRFFDINPTGNLDERLLIICSRPYPEQIFQRHGIHG